jgi:Fic family protein
MNGNDNGPERRHSVASEVSLISDETARAEREAKNGLLQFDLVRQAIEDGLAKGAEFRMRPSLLQTLHRAALAGLSPYAGNWRPGDVEITGSKLKPVPAYLVAEQVEDMCDYVNSNWNTKSALHLASYVMWRLNWIHPFSDGNGRTSRASSYCILCIKIGCVLPGTKAIPDFIVDNRDPYFVALEAADTAFAAGEIDVSKMEELLQSLLAKQLYGVLEAAGGALIASLSLPTP